MAQAERRAQRATVGDSLIPIFPGTGATEPYHLYRHCCTALMRAWVAFHTSDLLALPQDEHDLRIVVEELATQQIGRRLLGNETRLLAEVCRDVLTAKAILRDLEVEDLRARLHTPGPVFGRSA